MNNIVRQTGGKLLRLQGGEDSASGLDDFLSSVSADKFNSSKKKHGRESEVTDKILARIKPQKLNICEVDTSSVIKYGDDIYDGLHDLLAATRDCPNLIVDNIVELKGEISRPFNIVFTGNPSDRTKKQVILNNIKPGAGFCKLGNTTPLELLPMIYYKGAGEVMLLCGLEYEDADDGDVDEEIEDAEEQAETE